MKVPKYELRLNPDDRARLESIHAALGTASGMRVTKMQALRWAFKTAEEALGIAPKPTPPEGAPQGEPAKA